MKETNKNKILFCFQSGYNLVRKIKHTDPKPTTTPKQMGCTDSKLSRKKEKKSSFGRGGRTSSSTPK